MKIFFDTNVYVSEALRGRGASRVIRATLAGRWRIYSSEYVLDELKKVLSDDIGLSRQLFSLARTRIRNRSLMISSKSSAMVPRDSKDTPILQAAVTCRADYLVTNDQHLLAMDPFHGVRIISMDSYFQVLRDEGLLE